MKSRQTNAVARAGATASGTSRNNNREFKHITRGKPFEIWTARFDGSRRFYMGYPDRPTAELVANRLREIGLPCEIRVRT